MKRDQTMRIGSFNSFQNNPSNIVYSNELITHEDYTQLGVCKIDNDNFYFKEEDEPPDRNPFEFKHVLQKVKHNNVE